MSANSKRKGSAWERRVADYLAERTGLDVDRAVLRGNADIGDIAGLPGWAIEAKAEKKIRLAAYIKEAVAEQENADADWHAAVVKRRNHHVGRAYAVMELRQLADLIVAVHAAGRLDALADELESTADALRAV